MSNSGSDSNTGCSSSDPWQSLAQVNATTFAAGNQILFQSGGTWTGTLQPLGSGAVGSPIVVSNYGSGAAPIINGGGAASAIYIHNLHDWTVQNLEIKNTATTVALRAGFLADNYGTGILHGIHLVNNLIDNVNSTWSTANPQPSTFSAVSFDVTDGNKTANWDDVLISGNTIKSVDAGAIYIGSHVGLNHDISATNVVVQNNTITDAGGNSIVCVFCSSPLVQYNTATDSGYRFSGAALWSGWTTNGVWQFNEVARNWRSFVDGQAFDIDNSNTNMVVQYNYSHDNPSGFIEFCCSAGFGAKGTSKIRFNVSQNDGAQWGVFDTQNGLVTGATAEIYNNTVYMGPGDNGDVTSGNVNSGTSITYSNNIIYKLGTGGYNTGGTTWSHNLFYGNHPASEPTDASKIVTDPLLVSPGSGSDGRASANVYQLTAGSPALGAGVVIANNGGQDFYGNAVSSSAAPNIGAYNGPAVAAATPGSGTYLRFDESTGTSANDTSGQNNKGTLQAGASWATGTIGSGAVALSGANTSWVDIPKPVVDTAGSYTVSAWVKPNTLTGNQTYVSTDGSVISPFYLQLSGGKFVLTERSSDSTHSTYVQVLGPTAVAGTWYQLTGVYDATAHQIALYVNGVLQGTAAYSSGWTASGHTTVGRAKWNGANVDFANATIDDVRLLPRAVTAREAFALGTGAAAYFPLNEGTGTTFADMTGSISNGYLEGQSAWSSSAAVGTGALAFNGTLGTFAVSPFSAIDTSASFTVAAWVKFNSVSGIQTAVSMPGGNMSPFYLQLAGGKLTFTMRTADSTSSSATSVAATSNAATATWYHVAGVYDKAAGTVALYVNGALQGTAAYASSWKANAPTVIGAAEWKAVPVDFVNGAVDEVYFYNRALSAASIATLATP
ncbi:MAG: LamG-like jellyroll fold domain-containing protein [Pseudolysinimonas sp.]